MTTQLVNNIPLIHTQRCHNVSSVDHTPLFVYHNFFSADMCDALVAEAQQYLEPSRVGGPNNTTKIDRSVRSSSTAMLSEVSTAPCVLEAIKLIDLAYGHPHLNSNPLQFNQYQTGEEFKAHHDWHNPETQQARIELEGQRTWTFLMYLNGDFDGGTTVFPHLDIEIMPQRGMLVAWNNLNQDGSVNIATEHASQPVVRGTKYMMTKWFKNKVL